VKLAAAGSLGTGLEEVTGEKLKYSAMSPPNVGEAEISRLEFDQSWTFEPSLRL
jgi:hypothetical protein